MSPHRQAVAEALDAVAVRSEASYAWLGRRFDRPSGVLRAGDDAMAWLLEDLATRLYVDFYCAGGVAPAWDTGWPSADDSSGALSRSNRGRGSRQAGWVVRARDDVALVVERDGLRLRAPPERVIAARDPPIGAEVAVLLPEEVHGPADGFYTALGDAGTETAVEGPVDRVYWNIRAEGRAALVGVLTDRLNGLGLPFRLKVIADPAAARCDAAVLYTPRARRSEVAPVLPSARASVAAHLRAATPVFTLPVAPGVAFAEGPPDGESFGTHRCGVLAEAIVACHRRGVRDAGARLALVEERLAAAGVDLAAPHLGPGSSPGDEPPPL